MAEIHSLQISAAGEEGRKWFSFLALGAALFLLGVVALFLPLLSTFAVGVMLGATLAVSGGIQIVQSFQVRRWAGFTWHLLLGVVQLIGGVLVYGNPFAGAIAITAVLAATFIIQGVMQVALGLRVRPEKGWSLLLGSGVVAILAGGVLLAKFHFAGLYTPGLMLAASLMFGGVAYGAIGWMARRFGAERTAGRKSGS
ncbi:HdeD family acid-resistance protein [Flaviflagellibacter deserti]|jgi:uncharacterized membrane protein HdeD (DUF308 family)|uniref:HdeD family acid-resistance protein n=1 Tax=Flaviflagellibacter deserti TaxID=2267266 RepID=A0ABV9YZ05_9HYPH